MHPILARIGPFTLYSYGALVALGFAVSTFLIYKNAERFGLEKNNILDLAIFILVAGIIGARALYVFVNIRYYLSNPVDILNLSKGGLVWYGGFLSGFAACVWYIKRKRLSLWAVLDLLAPYIALAQGLGRMGCFLNGCCFGIETPPGYPLGVILSGEHIMRHPTQIYSLLALIAIFIILRLWQEDRHFVGEIFLGYCLLYSTKRFFIEFLRGDNPKMLFGYTLSQGISLILAFVCLVIFLQKFFAWKKTASR